MNAPMFPLSRRRFLSLSGGAVAASSFGSQNWWTPLLAQRQGGSTAPAAAARVLVLVQLNGGNDGLNAVVPSVGAYYDARPTLGIRPGDLLDIGHDHFAFHPALAPLVSRLRNGQMAALHGIGFADPDRSHFVSMDRWARADQLSVPTGWLGRWADSLASSLGPLDTVALAGGAPVLVGERHQPAVILTPAGFALPRIIGEQALRDMSQPAGEDGLFAAVQAAYLTTIGAVDAFAHVMSTEANDDEGDDDPPVDAAGGITASLDVAAKLISGSPSTRLIVVNAGGFDTHANQLADQQQLLADLAVGLNRFLAACSAAGHAERVLTVVISEFGRRLAENASGGTDHGAGGLALALGPMVRGGIHGDADVTHLVDGDLPPVIPALALLTTCASWLGADPAALLTTPDTSLATLLRQ